ncbi:hypothetical protein HYY69_00790 [Candidatus Woesearchaeota archaeon]|nr:hypothetical protein [Candidatus Woesearchaeota archaeon]
MSDLEAVLAETTNRAQSDFITEALERAQHFINHPSDDINVYQAEYEVVVKNLGVAHHVLSTNGTEERAAQLEEVVRTSAYLMEAAKLHMMIASVKVQPLPETGNITGVPLIQILSADGKPATLYCVDDLRTKGLDDEQIVGVLDHPLTQRVGCLPDDPRLRYAIPESVITELVGTSKRVTSVSPLLPLVSPPESSSPTLDTTITDVVRFGIYTAGTLYDLLQKRGIDYYERGVFKLLMEMTGRGMARKEFELDANGEQFNFFLLTEGGLAYAAQRASLNKPKRALPEIADTALIKRVIKETQLLGEMPLLNGKKVAEFCGPYSLKTGDLRGNLIRGADYVSGKVFGYVLSDRLVDAINRHCSTPITEQDLLKVVGLDPATKVLHVEYKNGMLELKLTQDAEYRKGRGRDTKTILETNPTLYLALGIEERLIKEGLYDPKSGKIKFPNKGSSQYTFDDRLSERLVTSCLRKTIGALAQARKKHQDYFRVWGGYWFCAEDILFLFACNFINGKDTSQRKIYGLNELSIMFSRSETDISTLIQRDYFKPDEHKKPATKVRQRFREAYNLVVDALKEGKNVAEKYNLSVP